MTVAFSGQLRPKITLKDGKIMHNGIECRVAIRKNNIAIGCSDITPEAMEFILKKHSGHFPKETDPEIVLQQGKVIDTP